MALVGGLHFSKGYLIENKLLHILAGFLGSQVFLFLLTAISHLEMMSFGPHFQAKLPEVIFSLLVAMFVSGFVHRVAVTTWYAMIFISKCDKQRG